MIIKKLCRAPAASTTNEGTPAAACLPSCLRTFLPSITSSFLPRWPLAYAVSQSVTALGLRLQLSTPVSMAERDLRVREEGRKEGRKEGQRPQCHRFVLCCCRGCGVRGSGAMTTEWQRPRRLGRQKRRRTTVMPAASLSSPSPSPER